MKSADKISGGVSTANEVVLQASTIILSIIILLALTITGYVYGTNPFTKLIFWAETTAFTILIFAIVRGLRITLREMHSRNRMAAGAVEARRHVEQLFHMSDMLQSALGYPDANAVLRATANELMAGFGGALYIFNNSGDRLDLSTTWDWPDETRPSATITPTQCWALKRGKSHLNEGEPGALCCEHHTTGFMVLEIPMMARGEVYGLLSIQAQGLNARDQLSTVAPIANAIAEGMSLALSNIALREKLRTQALRDPLTGLYNRRYMEDVLERYANLAERNGSPLSVIMIDLDHFKRLNDEHGHALGDAVLREVGGTLMGAIRPSDVACRYGGEELMVLLPDCSLAGAQAKAEIMRARIEGLSENHGFSITASFGVATTPESTDRCSDLLTNADAALYQAKQAGRNRVFVAPRRTNTKVHLVATTE
ncbi:GGDEF domain-containing protein [Sphingomonas paeninsulae]|nr:GGDEF domain-containing protein [Sphingomonas paeninsulae]